MRGEMAVLRLLEHQDEALTAGEISRLLSMTTSRIAAVLNSLEKKNMINRLSDPQDKRRVFVSLTQTGKETCLRRRGEAKAHLTALLSHLSREDAETFVRLAGQLLGVPRIEASDKEV